MIACGSNVETLPPDTSPTESSKPTPEPESTTGPASEPVKDATLNGFYTLIRYDVTDTDSAGLAEDSGESTLFIYIEFRDDGSALFFFVDEGDDVTYKISGNQVTLMFDVDGSNNELAGIIESDTIAFELDGFVMVFQLNPEFDPNDTPDDTSADTPTDNYITEEEARDILQTWIDTHPFQLGSNLEPGREDHVVKGVEYYLFYLGIERFGVAGVLVHKETGSLFHLSSPGNNKFEPLDVWYSRDHEIQAPMIVTYGRNPVTTLLGKPPEEAISVFGTPVSSSLDDSGGIINLYYDHILIWFDHGLFTFLENYNPGALEVDGVTLDKDRAALIGLLGEPDHEDWGEGAYGAENAYVMDYNMQNYRLYFEFWDSTDAPPVMVLINSR